MLYIEQAIPNAPCSGAPCVFFFQINLLIYGSHTHIYTHIHECIHTHTHSLGQQTLWFVVCASLRNVMWDSDVDFDLAAFHALAP